MSEFVERNEAANRSAGRDIRVVIADDQSIVREGLQTLLSLTDGIEIVGLAADGTEAVHLGRTIAPDVVLMDLRMPNMDGATATRELLADHADIAVLVLTTFDDDESIRMALAAGAKGYLTKDVDRQQLAMAIAMVHRGQMVLGASASRTAVQSLNRDAPLVSGHDAVARIRRRWPALTPREAEVLNGIGQEQTNRELAASMYIGIATVKTYVNNVFSKIQVENRRDARICARRAIEES